MTLIEYAIARAKAQLEQAQSSRPLTRKEQERLKILRSCVEYYKIRESAEERTDV